MKTSSSKTALVVLLLLIGFIVAGVGCTASTQRTYPPKPPLPGVQRSPVIERLTP